MGQDYDNEGGPFWDAGANAGAGGWVFASCRAVPFKHDDSPPVTRAQMAAIVQAAQVSEPQWHAVMPLDLRTWMQTRPAAQRANHLQGCFELQALADLL